MKKNLSISIPIRSIWSFFALCGLIVFAYFKGIEYLMPNFEIIFIKQENMPVSIVLTPIIAYILISAKTVLFLNIFKELKGQDGIVDFLSHFLFVSFSLALVLGLSVGSFLVSDMSPLNLIRKIFETTVFIGTIIFIIGFIAGVIIGLKKEFVNSPLT